MLTNRIFIAKHFGYKLQDAVKGTRILETLEVLKNSQYWDESRMYEYRLKKLKTLVDYSAKNVPYYENLFKSLKFTSGDIHNLDDIIKIPILTKEIFRKENANLLSRTFGNKNVKIGKTGGTTGVPIIVYKDVNNRSFTWASYYRWYEWMGLNYYDKIGTFWGAPTVLTKSFKSKFIKGMSQFVQNEFVLDSFNMGDKEMLVMYKYIKEQKPVLLKGYLSALINFARFIKENNLEIFPLKAVSTTTETLFPHHRKYLEDVFQTSVYDQYGCGEISAISYECKEHNGLHINQEHVICEVLNDYNKPILNESGRVVVTDLDNLVMPFIRYENGDLATLTDEKCTCGVNQQLMKSIDGRSVDTVSLRNGNKVHGVFFTDILYELNILTDQIQRFQVYQDTPGCIEFRIECDKPFNVNLNANLQHSLNRFFETVNIIEKKSLSASNSGKFRYIINEIKV